MSAWTVDQLPDCAAETAVVVTGANNGLRFEATKAFAANGVTVIMACRSTDRGARAAADIRRSVDAPDPDLDVRRCDLASLRSVESFATVILEEYPSVDVLCNNAGVMAIPRQESKNPFEQQFGANHLRHFALTGHLLGSLLRGDGENRIVTQSSGTHRIGEIDFDDLHHTRSYGKWEAYGQSKPANLLFPYELQRRLDAAGIADTISVACHSGYAATNLQRRGPKRSGSTVRLGLVKVANALVGQPAADGAPPLLYAATALDADGGEYYGRVVCLPELLDNRRCSCATQS
ncbi:MAG: oxidoreductase [Haloplanus sp.]